MVFFEKLKLKINMKKLLLFVCNTFLSRANYYRLARFLWLDARGDPKNSIGRNGELEVQSAVLKQAAGLDSAVCLDVGANLGIYSRDLLRSAEGAGVGEKLELFCFEPNPDCVKEIEKNLASFIKEGNISIVPKVMTNQGGEATFHVTGTTAGSSSLKVDERHQKSQKITVECVTFDGFCEQRKIDQVLFAKVDTEGNDMRVIEGAKEMLASGRLHYLQFEYNYRWIYFRCFLKDVFDLVEPLGYQIAKVTEKGLEVYPEWHNELEVYREGNYLIGKDFGRLGMPLVKSPIF